MDYAGYLVSFIYEENLFGAKSIHSALRTEYYIGQRFHQVLFIGKVVPT
ncbi:hypothetical protein [Rodentibacter mrazii]|nr:hypothetical protein [Rodentibacter mrazii]